MSDALPYDNLLLLFFFHGARGLFVPSPFVAVLSIFVLVSLLLLSFVPQERSTWVEGPHLVLSVVRQLDDLHKKRILGHRPWGNMLGIFILIKLNTINAHDFYALGFWRNHI